MRISFDLRAILFGFLGIALVAGLAMYFLSSSDAQKLLHQLNLTLQETNGRAQIRRMLVLNQKSLGDLSRNDIAAGLRPSEINALIPDLIARTNTTDDFKRENITLLSGAIVPGEQELTATVSLRKVFPELEIEMTATGNAAVAASQDTVFFGVYFNRLQVTQIHITQERFDITAAAPGITSAINGILGTINVVFDREINKKKALGARLILPPLYTGDLAKSGTKNLVFQPRQVDIFATIVQSAALITSSGIVVLAAAENKKPDPTGAKLPQMDEPTSMTDDEVKKAIVDYQTKFLSRYTAEFGADAPDIAKQSFLLVGRQYAARTLNDALKPPAICAKGHLSDPQPPFSSPITMPAPGQRKCDDVVNSCKYKDVCANNDVCKQTVEKEVDDTCNTVEKVFDPLGIAKTITHTSPCKVLKKVTEDVASPSCNAFRQTKAANPLFCNAGSNIVKAKCDTIVAGDVAFCQGEEELRKFIVSNPIAVLHGDVTPDVGFDACVSNPSFEANAAAFSASVAGQASGSLAIHLAFENKTPPGVGLCGVDWAEDFHFNASATIPNTSLSFAITAEAEGDSMNLVFSAGDQDLKVDFSPSPLDELFLKHPQLAVNCNVAAGLAAGYVTYDTIVNEQVKNLSPLLTGKGYKLTAKDVKFKLKSPRLDVKDLAEQVVFSLTPSWRPQALAFVK